MKLLLWLLMEIEVCAFHLSKYNVYFLSVAFLWNGIGNLQLIVKFFFSLWIKCMKITQFLFFWEIFKWATNSFISIWATFNFRNENIMTKFNISNISLHFLTISVNPPHYRVLIEYNAWYWSGSSIY